MGGEASGTLSGPLAPERGGLAIVRFGVPDSKGRHPVRAYAVPVERDGEKIDADAAFDPLAGTYDPWYETRVPRTGVFMTILRLARIAPQSPAMWFVAVDVSRQFGDGMRSMVGFASDRFEDGSVLDEMQFVPLGVDNNSQVGAITWSRHTGVIDQLYVSPEMRRHQVGTRMINAAAAYHHTMGWPGVLSANGRRTLLGEAMAMRNPRPQRVAPHSELSPPMDPA